LYAFKGMFNYIKESNVYWFTTQGMEAEYNLIGVVMGLAVYNSEMLDIHFPPCVYKKLLPSSMSQLCDPKAIVGTTNLGLYDLKYIHPTLASSLQELLDYEGDVEGDFLLRFEVSFTEFDVVKLVPLKENGHKINLTNENRKEYVSLYVDFLLNKLIYKQFAAFYHGFHSVCASNAVIVIRFFAYSFDTLFLVSFYCNI
jgi:E3 ubiquitin-protein ligase HECTD2